MNNVVDVLWFAGSQCIGIVCVKTKEGKHKFYIGRGDGVDEDRDKQAIADWGVPIDLEHLKKFVERRSRDKVS